MDTTFHGRLLHSKVFLEGQEVPCTSIRVQGGMGAPCVCNVTIPYADAAHKLAPRTLIHVFTMDSRYESGLVNYDYTQSTTGMESRSSTPVDVDSAAALLCDRNKLSNYKLMFVGEVVKYEYTKVGSLRRMTLICQDFTRYWQDAKLYWGRRNTSLHGYKQAIFAGATQLYRGRRRVDSSSDLINLLRARPSANKDIPGLLGGLVATLESVTGVFSPDADRRFRGVNDYMSYAELRLHLSRMIGASHKDDSSTTFISSRSFRRYLRRVSRQVKSTASFMDMMQMVLDKCYQSWNSVPCPPLVEGEKIEYEYLHRVAGYNFRNDTDVNALYQSTEAMYNSLTQSMQETQESTRASQDPTVRLGHEHDIISVRNDGDGGAEANTAIHERTQSAVTDNWTGALAPTLTSTGGISQLETITDRLVGEGATLTGAAGRANRNAAAAVGLLGHAGNKLHTIHGDGEDVEGHTTANYNAARQDLGRALDLFRRASGTTYDRRPIETDIKSRLHCFLFHPDIYMLPPPKCNVLFPDQVQAIQFSRAWMSEISRIWLHGRTSSGRDRRNCYFSPNTSILGATLNTESGTYDSDDIAAEAVRRGTGFLMPHEKYTGVISSIVGLGDNDIFRRLHVAGLAEIRRDLAEGGLSGDALQAQVAADSSEFMGDAEHSPQPHMQRAANYMFFQQRYNARSLTATLRYTPQLVAGMPCLLLDPMRGQKSRFMQGNFGDSFQYGEDAEVKGWKYTPGVDPDEDRDAFNRAALHATKPQGTHFVGILHRVSHTINAQGGAQTKITMTMCREHNEIANIFKDTDNDGKPDAHLVKRTRRRSPPIAPVTDTAHTDNTVVDGSFTAAYRGDSGDGEAKYDLTAQTILGNQWSSTARYDVQVVRDSTGGAVTTADDGTDITQAYYVDPITGFGECRVDGVGSPGAKVTVRRVWTDSTPKAQNFTFESMARPPWMANVFSPERIGPEYYQKMFGCGSIMDGNIPVIAEDFDLEDADTTDVTSGEMDPIQLLKLPFKKGGKTAYGADGEEIDQYVYIPKELLETGGSTQAIADQLSEVWLGLKEMGADTNRFVDLYTERAMADIPSVLGTLNKSMMVKNATTNAAAFQINEQRVEGFHCWAYGQFFNLEKGTAADPLNGTEPIEGASERLNTTNPASPQRTIDPNIDTRDARYTLVSSYLQQLSSHMGNRTQSAGSHTGLAPLETDE